MRKGKMSAGALTAIIIGIVTALAVSGAFGADDERADGAHETRNSGVELKLSDRPMPGLIIGSGEGAVS